MEKLVKLLSDMTGMSYEEIIEAALNTTLKTREYKTAHGTLIVIEHDSL